MTQLIETTIVGVFFPITLYAEKQLSPRNMYQGRICGMMDCIPPLIRARMAKLTCEK